MKKIAVSLMSSRCLLMVLAAWATWGSLVSTGSATGRGVPSCAFVSSGQVVGAVRSGNSAVMADESKATWSTWTTTAGKVTSEHATARKLGPPALGRSQQSSKSHFGDLL
jgi:hypothetical protein